MFSPIHRKNDLALYSARSFLMYSQIVSNNQIKTRAVPYIFAGKENAHGSKNNPFTNKTQYHIILLTKRHAIP